MHHHIRLEEGLNQCLELVQVLSLETWKLGLLLLVTDLIFVATSYKFLDLADAFDRDWHKTRTPYPGRDPFFLLTKLAFMQNNRARECTVAKLDI